MQKSIARIWSSLLTLMLVACGASLSSAASITFQIKDGAGNLLPGATLYAVTFGQNGPDGTNSKIAMDEANDGLRDGIITITNLQSNTPYDFYVSLQNKGPAVRSQMFNPEHPHVFMDSGADGSTGTITLKEIYTDRGTVTAHVINATTGRMVFGNVRKISTGKDVAFGACYTGGGTTCDIIFDNVPAPAADGTYDVSAFDPSANNGLGSGNGGPTTGRGALTVGGNLATANIDISGGLPPDLSANDGGNTSGGPQPSGQTGQVAVEGVLEDITSSTTTIPWTGINIKVSDGNGNKFNRFGTGVDQNGRFQIWGPLDIGTTYFVQSFGGCRQDGRCYDGYETASSSNPVTSRGDFIYTDSTTVKVIHVKLQRTTPGTYSIPVYVKDSNGRMLPGSNVNLNGDGQPWHTDKNVQMCDHQFHSVDVSSPAFVNLNVMATTGYALLTGLKPGNYQLQAWSQFGNGSNVFNAGADSIYQWGGQGVDNERGCFAGSADDRRLTIEQNGEIRVYDASGTAVGVNMSTAGITIIVPLTTSNAGVVTGTLTFPEPVDLRNDPITLSLSACDNTGCQGNFDTIGDDETPGQTSYTYSIHVKPREADGTPIQYYMQVTSNYWGRVQEGGGQDQIIFGDTGSTLTRNFKFAKAGRIVGKLFKPDGSVFIPGQQADNTWLNGGVNAHGLTGHSWGNAQILQDGSFVMGGLTPGIYEVEPQVFGGNVSYSAPEPLVRVNVTQDKDVYTDVKFVDGQVLKVNMDISNFPPLHKVIKPGDNYNRGESWTALRVPAGTVFDTETIGKILVHDNDSLFMQYSDPYSGGNGPCRTFGWAGGFCPQQLPTGKTLDIHMTRWGSIDGGMHQYMTFIGSKKNVVIDQAHATGTMFSYNGSSVTPVEVNFTQAAPSAGAALAGVVTASNIFRESDFKALGGSFNNFVKFIPIISVYDTDGNLQAVGLVTPPPETIGDDGAVGKAIDQSVANNDYTEFQTATHGLQWSYEIRGIPANKKYIIVGTTPNYPPFSQEVTLGVVGSTTTLNVNWDAIGAGATISGVVQSTASVVIANASVEIDAKGVKTKTLLTGTDGSFRLPGLPTGKYTIKATADGFAPLSEELNVSTYTLYQTTMSLTAAPGSITGTVRELALTSRGPVIKPVSGATILAYDDTFNVNNLSKPLALYKVTTSSEGVYTINGVIAGDVYKIFADAPGRYIDSVSTPATSGVVANVDFSLKQKPLQVEVFGRPRTPNYEFSILNPNNFESGKVYWYHGTAGNFDVATASDISNSFTQLPDGSLVGTIPLSALTVGEPYTLHIIATPSSGEADVIKELPFGLDVKNSEQPVDDKIIGDDSRDESGHQNNEVPLDSSGGSNTSIEMPTGCLLQTSTADVPTINLTAQSTGTLSGDQSSFGETFAGDVYTVTFSSLQFTGRDVVLNLGYDPGVVGGAVGDLGVFHFNPNTNQWTQVPGQVSIDPVTNVVSLSANPDNLPGLEVALGASNLSKRGVGMRAKSVGAPRQSMKAASNGKQFFPNAKAASSGSGSFVVGLAASTGSVATAVGYHQYNFPNPFNLETKTVNLRNGTMTVRGTVITVAPTGTGIVPIRVRIYNVAGDLVRELNYTGDAGRYKYYEWDGKNTAGDDVASGVYFAAVDAPGAPKREPIKMVLVK